jgi:hypothetical protein
MRDYAKYFNLLSFLGVPHFLDTHYSIKSGWDWASYLAALEKQDSKEKLKE